MITLHNLEKYFNRKKSNEIHVINDISLTLPDRGLVVLLGPSGSGKSTLLNVLGGLDKTQAGVIDFDGQEIVGYKSKTWDNIRNEHIGYVFQNYNLLYDQSVYDNIALSLRMVGITDKEEIDTRVDYLLNNMGMINYRRRKAAALSGGQQQRVAIARALAKNPKVIIADEPTGNLDSKNTYDIMNILRAISQTKLVVLVTHEEDIADLYADRIIRLRDGRIVEDKENRSIGGIDVQLETDIYLKDLKQIADYDSGKTSYKVFSDEETDSNFDVKLIVKNKTLYVQVNSDKFTRINLLEKDSEVKVFDDHFKGQEIEEFSQTEFDLAKVIDDTKRTTGGSVIPLKEAIRLGFGQFKDLSRMKMFRNVLFFLNAVVISIALALLFNAYTIDDLDFITVPVNQVQVQRSTENYDVMKAYEDDPSIAYMNLVGNMSLRITLPKVYQSQGRESTIGGYPQPIEYLDESKLVIGRTALNQNEVVLNKHFVEQAMRDSSYESLGIQTLEDFLNLSLTYKVFDEDGLKEIEVKIVGIAEIDDLVYYAKEETIWQIKTGYAVLEAYEDEITIVKGAKSDAYRTLLVRDSVDITLPLSALPTLDISETSFTIEGSFTTTNEDVPVLLIGLDKLKELYYAQDYSTAGGTVFFQTVNPANAILTLGEDFTVLSHPYESQKAEFAAIKLLSSIPYIMFAGVFLAAAFVGTYFIMRSSLLSRIYEVSVYRALGAPKKDLRNIFLIETIILTLFTSLIGYLATTYVLIKLQLATEGYFEIVRVTPLSILGGMLIILLVNIISGVLPVTNLLKRTPAEIISKYDF